MKRGEDEDAKTHHSKFVEQIFSKLDEDNNGEIDYRGITFIPFLEFIYACSDKRKLLTHSNMARAFRAIDIVSRIINIRIVMAT